MMDDAELAVRNDVIELISACWQTQVAGVAVDLGIFDLLDQGKTDSMSIAAACGAAQGPVRRLLRALCSLDLAQQKGEDSFALTPRGALLRTEGEGSLAALARTWASSRWNAWGQLGQSVRTGETIPGHFLSASPDPALGIAASKAQADRTRLAAVELADTYDFSGVARVLDVGGGHGTVLAAILKAHSNLEGAVFELPHHEPQARRMLDAEGASRGGFVGGSFFDSVAEGYDCLILKSILHDWPDAECRAILRSCAAAMPPGGRLLVIEQILPEIADTDPELHSAWRTDLTMLLSTGGLERTEAELATLLADSGLVLKEVSANRSEFRVIEARLA
jgi:hypothetical protein